MVERTAEAEEQVRREIGVDAGESSPMRSPHHTPQTPTTLWCMQQVQNAGEGVDSRRWWSLAVLDGHRHDGELGYAGRKRRWARMNIVGPGKLLSLFLLSSVLFHFVFNFQI
jgi:hypothetical protein